VGASGEADPVGAGAPAPGAELARGAHLGAMADRSGFAEGAGVASAPGRAREGAGLMRERVRQLVRQYGMGGAGSGPEFTEDYEALQVQAWERM
jgi:hypothetical protein